MSAATWVAFVAAAAIGAVARAVVDGRLAGRSPLGTFAVNVTGSFALGAVVGLAIWHGLGDGPRLVLGTGFCGAYTTFSTAAVDSVRLAGERGGGPAVAYAAGSLVATTAAAAAGLALASLG